MWTTTYRTHKLNDVILEESIRNKINRYIQIKDIPNLIIMGKHGIGKTYLAETIALELNANTCVVTPSLEKDLKIFQKTFETFCKKNVNENIKRIMIIDDVDNFQQKNQMLITAYVNNYNNIKFIFTCNELNITDQIQSRCVILNLSMDSTEKIIEHLNKICLKEKIDVDESILVRLCEIYQNNINIIMNTLQVMSQTNKKITKKDLNKICDIPDSEIIDELFLLCIKKDKKKLIQKISELNTDGYSCSDVLEIMFNTLKKTEYKSVSDETTIYNLSEDIKIKFLKILGKSRYQVNKINESLLQFIICMIKLCDCVV